VAKRKRPKLTWRCRRDLAQSNQRRGGGLRQWPRWASRARPEGPGGMARSLLAEPGGSPPAFALRVPLPVPVPTLPVTGLLDYLRRPTRTFKLARKQRQGPWVLTQGKSTLIAIALATVPWWAEVRCHSGIDHGDGAFSPGSCMELGGAAAGMLRSGPRPAH
jgi:hypothetical protein